MKKALTLIIGATLGLNAVADIPEGYYNRMNGKTGAELKQVVHEIINPHTTISSYSALPQYFQQTDVYPESDRWWDMYSNVTRYIPSFSGLNREHAFPKSWWGGLTSTPAYIDLNHLYPSDGPANQAKSNYPLGEVSGNPKFDNNVTRVGYPVSGQGGGAQYVFEPDDEYKGDFARAYFYMATCYSNLTWATKYLWMVQQNDYPTLTGWAVDLLLKWAREDGVSQKEIERNEVVYGYQNNRNPFIDFPDLAEYIWGNKKGESFVVDTGGTGGGDPILTAPVAETTRDFGQVAVGQSITSQFFFKGENLTGSLSLRMGGENKEMFTMATNSINSRLVNSSTGYYLEVTYTPTSVGEHNARILIYDGGLTGSIYVNFRGQAFPEPTLSTLTAYEASGITSSSYTASWSAAPEVIDAYVLTVNRWKGNDVITEEIEVDGELTSWDITEFDASDSESYSVQSSRLGFRSPASNVVFVTHSGITDIEASRPLTATCYPGVIRLQCPEPQTDGCIYDMAGRLFMTIPVIDTDMELSLPEGIYILTTRQHPAPIKLIAY